METGKSFSVFDSTIGQAVSWIYFQIKQEPGTKHRVRFWLSVTYWIQFTVFASDSCRRPRVGPLALRYGWIAPGEGNDN